ncbi:hypothetical protein STENM327S_06458 [Streptomyces tendae]
MTRRHRVPGDRDGPSTPVDQRGRETDVADGRGDAGQGGQPVHEPGRDRGPLGSATGRSPLGWSSWPAATTTSAPPSRPGGSCERSPDSASTPVAVIRAAPPSTAHATRAVR